MRIAVPAENATPMRARVAATPETVKALDRLGAEVVVRGRRRVASPASRSRHYVEAGAAIAPTPPPTVGRRRRGAARCAARAGGARRRPARRRRHRDHGSLRPYRRPAGARRRRTSSAFAMELMPRITRAQVDGRAVEPGQSRRLSRRDRRGGRIWPRHPDDDDGGGHGSPARRSSSWASASPACRRSPRRAASAASSPRPTCGPRPRSRCDSLGAKFIAVEDEEFKQRRDRGRLRQGNVAGISGQAGGADGVAYRQAGHRHHHGADSRPRGAGADHGGDGRARCGPARSSSISRSSAAAIANCRGPAKS